MIPSTGVKIQTDTTYVTIPIEYIRLANQKLIERNYLIEVNAHKDSIIIDYKRYIEEYERIDKEYKTKIKDYERINKNLYKSLEKQKKISLVCGSVAGASILVIGLISLVN